MAAERIRTVERDPRDGLWIARNPYTGAEILEEGFRWFCRESARTAVWEARHLSDEAKTFKQLLRLGGLPYGVQSGSPEQSKQRNEGGPT